MALLLLPVAVACTRDAPRTDGLELAAGGTARVVKVVKGDEVVVSKGDASTRVRLLGIYAFDDRERAGAQPDPSVAFLDATVVGHDVTLVFDVPVKDVHGRYLAYAALDGRDLNETLLERGAAIVYTEFPFAREAAYLRVEQAARSAKRGLWARADLARLIPGLRRQWSEYRLKQFGSRSPDPLLAVAPATEATPAPGGDDASPR